jgi:hypothetical protein
MTVAAASDFRRSGLSEKQVQDLIDRNTYLEALINSPETADWLKGVPLEAAHQIERWGAIHDAGKSALDWFWLIGYLAQKAAMSEIAGDAEKAKHHTISTAAVLLNWHKRLSGEDFTFRPGIAEPNLGESAGATVAILGDTREGGAT